MFQTDLELRASDLFRVSPRRRSAFTLVEMLVVIGIIVVLVALLVPVAAVAVSRTRDFSMTAEISQLAQAIESYKKEKGDYPPSFGEIDGTGSLYRPATRYTTIVERHLRKCYPKMTPQEKDIFYNRIVLDQNGNARFTGDEALVFWLSLTCTDERNPFTSQTGAVLDPNTNEYVHVGTKKYYDFKPERLQDFDPNDTPTWTDANNNVHRLPLLSFKPNYAGETAYLYIDSRSYAMHRNPQAPGNIQPVQAYFNDQKFGITGATQQHYMNPTTFQILCAGQDKEFGAPALQFDNNNVIQFPKWFKNGVNYTDEDKDNLTNFAEGRRLVDHIP